MKHWPFPDLPRIFGAREALVREERHYRARHIRPQDAGHAAQRRLERARDAWAAGCATEAEKALVRGDRWAIAIATGDVR